MEKPLRPAPACVIELDDDGIVVEFDEAAERLFGYSRDEAIGRKLADLIMPGQLRRERIEAERDRQHLAEVVRGTQDAVLSKDLDGVVTSWNPAAERLYGYSAEEAIGRHISFLVPPDHENEEKRILDRVRRGERLETYETERIREDGARIDVSLTISPIENPVLGVVGASVIARDITAERRAAPRPGVPRRRQPPARHLARPRPRPPARSSPPRCPELAEICVIDFLRDDGWLGDSIVAGADPEAAARLEQIRRRHAARPRRRAPGRPGAARGQADDLARPEGARRWSTRSPRARITGS